MQMVFPKILNRLEKLGITKTATLLQRTVGEQQDAFTGEPKITWEDAGSITVVLSEPVMMEGFDEIKQEVVKRTVWTTSEITYLDRLTVDGITYSIGPVKHNSKAGYYSATITRLVEPQ